MTAYKRGMCKSPYGKGKASVEFYKNGKPQYYCYGFTDRMTDELINECKECSAQVQKAEYDVGLEG